MRKADAEAIVPSVLLVDDLRESLLALEATLKPLGVRLAKARSGEEALRQLRRGTFAVILLDIQMPRLDGLQTAALIRDREQTRHIPIIFLTAFARETAYVFRAYAHGAVDYLLKPVEPEILPVGKGELLRGGEDVLVVGFGPIVARGMEAADALAAEGWSVGVVNARFAKPLDADLILEQARGKRLLVTLEESVAAGGFGSAVLEALEAARLTDTALRDVPIRIIGIPPGAFVPKAS